MRAFILTVIVATATPAMAQVIAPPPRSSVGLFGGRHPLDPNRTSQELMLTASFLGGHDDLISPIATSSTDPATMQLAGFTATTSTELRYTRGRTSRMFETTGRAYLNSYSNVGLKEHIGGDLDLRGSSSLGRRARLTADGGVHYEPTFLFNGVGPAHEFESGAAPDYGATFGVTEERWLAGTASASLEYEWNQRQSTFGQFFASDRQAISGSGFDTHESAAMVRHQWNFRRRGGVRFSFRDSDQQTIDELGHDQPFSSQSAEIGLTLQKRYSATRRLEVSGSGGATRARTASLQGDPAEFVVPSGSGQVRLDLVRTWAVTFDVRRDVTILQGISPQPFISRAASVSAGGTVGRRYSLAVTADVGRGHAREGDQGAFESVSGVAQLQFPVSRRINLLAAYRYYNHLLRDVATVPVGFPTRYDRNQLHVGVTMNLPLYGSF